MAVAIDEALKDEIAKPEESPKSSECSSKAVLAQKEDETEGPQSTSDISETSPVTEGLKLELEKASSSLAVKNERPAMEKPDTSTGSFFELHAAAAKIDGPMTVTISNTYNYNDASPKRKRLCLKKTAKK